MLCKRQRRNEVIAIGFFESEMQKLCTGIPYIKRPAFMGKTMIARLDDDLRVKINFQTANTYNTYEALQVRIINRTDGEVDSQWLWFKELINDGRPHSISDYGHGFGWFYKPSQSDYAKITEALHNYIATYAPEMEQESDMGMGGQGM